MPVTGIYARASKDPNDKRISCDRQIERCTKLAAELFAGDPVLVFEDNDRSGADPNVERPGYENFVAAVRRGDIGQVVVHEQSRLTRQPQQWEELVVTLTRAGITKVHTVQSGVVPVDAGNRLLGRIMAVIDAEEAERLKARIRAAMDQIRVEGRPGGGTAPYGYRSSQGDDRRPILVIDDDEAKVIGGICDAICDGYSLRSIAADLNRRGVPSPRGSRWNATVIRAMVLRPSMAGFRTRSVKTKGRGESHEIVGTARWEPVLTEQRWRQTLDMLGASTVTGVDGKTHTARRHQPGRPRKWLLSGGGGLGRCKLCDSGLVVVTSNTNASQYRCDQRTGCGNTTIQPAEDLEAWIHQQLVAYLASNPKLPPALVSEDPERVRLEEERRRAERDMVEAVILKGDGDIDSDEFRVMHSGAKKRRDQAQAELADRPVPDTAIPDVDAIAHRWEKLPLERKRKALAHYIESVTVHPATGNHLNWTQHERFAARVKIAWKV
ncbi:MAG TPA: recombinase family protein [Acidimicrobiales bacterium]|jgi:DNA invertase Pin-like site-specific DNA recombinase